MSAVGRIRLLDRGSALAGPPAQRDGALYEAAKKEGEVVWYTSLIVNQAVRPLVEAFNKKYPGVEVKYARGDSGPNAIKVMNEARAGKVEGDVFDGIATTPPLLKAGLVEQFAPSEPTNIRRRCAIRTAAGMRWWCISSRPASTRNWWARTR